MLRLIPHILIALGGHSVAVDSTHCVAAARFMRTERHMVAEIGVDTLDDWRTKKKIITCRITAVGGTDIGVQKEAVRFYEVLRAAKWVRTPDPRDSPNEGSLRFRWQQSDCLFNINREALLGTDAEGRVNERLALKPGEERYQMYVVCTPAMPAAPRDTSDALLVGRWRLGAAADRGIPHEGNRAHAAMTDFVDRGEDERVRTERERGEIHLR